MSETILFFGSGPVAAESLKLLAEDFGIEAVVTKPRPPHHKDPYPVIEVAHKLGLKILYTSNSAELSLLFKQTSTKSRLGVVIDYGILFDQTTIERFPLGLINSHFSLLPRLRGPDPITFAILNGDAVTGVSVMRIVPALDEGPLIGQSSIALDENITTPQLTEELIKLSHQLLADKLPSYVSGKIKPSPQDTSVPATYTKKLTKADGELDFSLPAEQLEREIRAYMEWPRSRTTIGGIKVIVTKAHVIEDVELPSKPGELWRPTKSQLGLYTSKGILALDNLIPAGKKEMPISAFLAGYSLDAKRES